MDKRETKEMLNRYPLKKALFFIFIFAFLLRFYSVIIQQDQAKMILLSDAKQYDNIAVNLFSGKGFTENIDGKTIPTAKRMPVYPLFLAGIYTIFGHNYFAARLVQALLGAILCILIFFITKLVYDDLRTALIAAFLIALYKPFVSGFNYYGGPTSLMSEYFHMFIACMAILSLLFFFKKENHTRAILAGFCIGLAILTRAEFIFYPMVLFFYLFYECKWSLRSLLKRFFIFYLLIILTMMPWVIRNYIAYKKIIPLATYHGGLAFWTGNSSVASGGWNYPMDYEETMKKLEKWGVYEQDKEFFKKGMEELKRDPSRIPFLFTRKILVHWAPFENGFKLFNPYYAAALLLGVVGILFFRRRDIMEGLLITVFFATSLVAIITYGDPRYRYPYEPYLIIFTSLSISEALKRL